MLPAFVFLVQIYVAEGCFITLSGMCECGMNGGDFEKSLLIDVLLIASFSFDNDSKLPIVLFAR